MNMESEIFKNARVILEELLSYGFIKDKDIYKYSKKIMNDSFKINIEITQAGQVSGKIYDLEADSEYTAFRIKDNVGGFANSIKEEYQKILKDIKSKCFKEVYFSSLQSNQANRITDLIISLYHDRPEFLWANYPGYGIFRNASNKKWYAGIMNVSKLKLAQNEDLEVAILNVKQDFQKIPDLLKKKGFYPAYHMNKKNWVTIILDDALSDTEIMQYVKTSYRLLAF